VGDPVHRQMRNINGNISKLGYSHGKQRRCWESYVGPTSPIRHNNPKKSRGNKRNEDLLPVRRTLYVNGGDTGWPTRNYRSQWLRSLWWWMHHQRSKLHLA